jgi:hypothetical protein
MEVIVPPTPPIICTLTPGGLQARRTGLLSELLNCVHEREALSDGICLKFDPTSEVLSTIVQAVDAERHCCRFLRFAITVEPDGGPVVLELTGPPGTAEFLAGLFEK